MSNISTYTKYFQKFNTAQVKRARVVRIFTGTGIWFADSVYCKLDERVFNNTFTGEVQILWEYINILKINPMWIHLDY